MLSWVAPFSLILFDFDGLLVNTEKIHYMAYQETLKKLGFSLSWNFAKYVSIAHFKAEGLEEEIYKDFPELKQKEPEWKSIYRVKRETYLQLLEERQVEWMPGAEELLTKLHDIGKKLVVVTHSDAAQIALIKAKLEKLSLIPHWITREDYAHPKPSSDCYKLAITKYAPEGGKVIGFEDSPRGLSALMGTEAVPVLVTDVPYPEIDFYRKQGAIRLRSLSETLRDGFQL